MCISKFKEFREKFRKMREEPKDAPIHDWDILHLFIVIKSIRTFLFVLLGGTLLGMISNSVTLASRSSTFIVFLMLFAISFSFNLIQHVRTRLEGEKAVSHNIWGKTMYFSEEKKTIVKIYKILLYIGDGLLLAFLIINFFI